MGEFGSRSVTLPVSKTKARKGCFLVKSFVNGRLSVNGRGLCDVLFPQMAADDTSVGFGPYRNHHTL